MPHPPALSRLLSLSLADIDAAWAALTSGGSVSAWEAAMQESLFKAHAAAAMLTNDRRTLTIADQRAIRASLAPQFDYLRSFAKDVQAGDLAERGAVWRARARLYAGSVKEAWWRGATQGYNLPAYPTQGSECRVNCGCSWRIEPLDDQGNANAYWERAKDDSCSTCLGREAQWNPLPIRPAVGG